MEHFENIARLVHNDLPRNPSDFQGVILNTVEELVPSCLTSLVGIRTVPVHFPVVKIPQ